MMKTMEKTHDGTGIKDNERKFEKSYHLTIESQEMWWHIVAF